jgi:hypothetical protein
MEKRMNRLCVLSLLIATASVFGQESPSRPMPRRGCGDQGQKIAKSQMMSGFNAPSRVEVRGSWDIYGTASFIYWQLVQDNMEVAFVDKLSNAKYLANQVRGKPSQMNFDYKPGFKVGLGMNLDLDYWDVYADYTMLHAKNHASTNSPTLPKGGIGPLFPTGGHPSVVPTNVYNGASENWRSNLDLVNLDLGRSYFVGTQLTFRPFFGMRGAFITQNTHYTYVNHSFISAIEPFEVPGVMNVFNRAHSWGVGPRVGLNTDWMLGLGIRFFGNANVDVLYTKYKVKNNATFIATTTVDGVAAEGDNFFFKSISKAPTLRTHLDLELGLGWGSYFDSSNWHIDLSAAYGFQVFFDQALLDLISKFIYEICHQSGPPVLVGSSEPSPSISMKMLVEKQVILKVRVLLDFFCISIHGA